MQSDERKVLERATQRVTEQAADANAIVDEAMDAGLDGSEPFVINIKRLRAELLSVKPTSNASSSASCSSVSCAD